MFLIVPEKEKQVFLTKKITNSIREITGQSVLRFLQNIFHPEV